VDREIFADGNLSDIPPSRRRYFAEEAWMPANSSVLFAWLYDVDQYGKSQPTWPDTLRPMKAMNPGAVLHVSVDASQDSATQKYLKAPSAEGMASEPVTVGFNPETGYWIIRNSGRTNALRIQQYGLPAIPLGPGATMPMTGKDVAVWIPVAPRGPQGAQGEAFRLLILAGVEPLRETSDRELGTETMLITAPRRYLSPATQEALIAYFGDHLSWPPLPAPYVRQQKEVEEIAVRTGLLKYPTPQNWARNRHDVLAGKDGLFTAADWYPRLGGPGRTLANHLAAFHRLVELRSITLCRVQRWAIEHDVAPYVIIDKQLGTTAVRAG
jgi:hypothetical protein